MNTIKTLLTTSRERLHVVVPADEAQQKTIMTLVAVIIEYPIDEHIMIYQKMGGLGYLPVRGMHTLDEARRYFGIREENAA